MQTQPRRVSRAQAALVVVDVQERLLPAMSERERLVQNTVRLIKGAAVLGVPMLATEQCRRWLRRFPVLRRWKRWRSAPAGREAFRKSSRLRERRMRFFAGSRRMCA